MEKKIKIKNGGNYWKLHKYVVYRTVDGDNWFYGAYDDVEKLNYVLREVPNALFAETENCEAVW